MIPIKKWTLRLWFIDVSFLNKGMWLPGGFDVWRFNFKCLDRDSFVGKRKAQFYKH